MLVHALKTSLESHYVMWFCNVQFSLSNTLLISNVVIFKLLLGEMDPQMCLFSHPPEANKEPGGPRPLYLDPTWEHLSFYLYIHL